MGIMNFLLRGGADFSGVERELRELSRRMTSFQNEMAGVFSGISRMITRTFNISSITNFSKESLAMYKETAQQETKLATVMRASMAASDESIQDMLDFIAAESELGVVGADAMTAAAQELGTYLDSVEALKGAIPILNNISTQQNGIEVSSGQLQQTATMLGKVLDGQLGGLSEWGYSWTQAQEEILKTGTTMEKVAVIADVVGESVGDMNYALAGTDPGQQAKLADAMSDVRAQFGAAVNDIVMLFIPALKKLVAWFGEVARYARVAAQFISEAFGKKAEPKVAAMAAATDNASYSMEDYGDSVIETAKKMDKSLAPFDTIVRLMSNASDAAEDTADGLDDTISSIGSGIGTGVNFGIQADVDMEGMESFKEFLATIVDFIKPVLELLGVARDLLVSLWVSTAPLREWIAGVVQGFLEWLIELLTAFTDWCKANPEAVNQMAKAIIALFVGMWVFTKVIAILPFLEKVRAAIVKFGPAIKTAISHPLQNLKTLFSNLGAAIKLALSNPLTLVIVVIGLVIAALATVPGGLEALGEALGAVFKMAFELFKFIADIGKLLWDPLLKTLLYIVGEVLKGLLKGITWFIEKITIGIDFIRKGLSIVAGLFGGGKTKGSESQISQEKEESKADSVFTSMMDKIPFSTDSFSLPSMSNIPQISQISTVELVDVVDDGMAGAGASDALDRIEKSIVDGSNKEADIMKRIEKLLGKNQTLVLDTGVLAGEIRRQNYKTARSGGI